jgi:DNA-binding SARP family transcriptional activator
MDREIRAAKVAQACRDIATVTAHFSKLVEIHAAPEWLWPGVISAMAVNGCYLIYNAVN